MSTKFLQTLLIINLTVTNSIGFFPTLCNAGFEEWLDSDNLESYSRLRESSKQRFRNEPFKKAENHEHLTNVRNKLSESGWIFWLHDKQRKKAFYEDILGPQPVEEYSDIYWLFCSLCCIIKEEISDTPHTAWLRQARKVEWATLKFFEAGKLIIEDKNNRQGLPKDLTDLWKEQINIRIAEDLELGKDLWNLQSEDEENDDMFGSVSLDGEDSRDGIPLLPSMRQDKDF